jgi:transposase
MKYKYRFIRPLTPDEISTLDYGYENGAKHYFRVKCKSILMSNEGKTIFEIAAFAKKTTRTIRNWFDSFEAHGPEKLVISKGRGIKAPLDALTGDQVKLVKKEIKKNYQNLKAVCTILGQKLGFEVTKWMLVRFIKKNSGTAGAGSGKT